MSLFHHLGLGFWSFLANPAAGLVESAQGKGPHRIALGLVEGFRGLISNIVYAFSNATVKALSSARKVSNLCCYVATRNGIVAPAQSLIMLYPQFVLEKAKKFYTDWLDWLDVGPDFSRYIPLFPWRSHDANASKKTLFWPLLKHCCDTGTELQQREGNPSYESSDAASVNIINWWLKANWYFSWEQSSKKAAVSVWHPANQKTILV